MVELRERIVRAHGGHDRWASVERLMASLSLGGAAFMTHMQPRPLRHVDVSVLPASGVVTLAPFPDRGRIGAFDGRCVWLEGVDGEILAHRRSPGEITRSPGHWVAWDELDLLYVAAVTAWHALLFPWLVTDARVAIGDPESVSAEGGRLERVSVTFPEAMALPSPNQTWYTSRTGLVRRIDLTTVAFGGWLPLGQVMTGYDVVDGLVLPTSQTFYPAFLNNQLWRATRFVWLTLEDLAVSYADAPASVVTRHTVSGNGSSTPT